MDPLKIRFRIENSALVLVKSPPRSELDSGTCPRSTFSSASKMEKVLDKPLRKVPKRRRPRQLIAIEHGMTRVKCPLCGTLLLPKSLRGHYANIHDVSEDEVEKMMIEKKKQKKQKKERKKETEIILICKDFKLISKKRRVNSSKTMSEEIYPTRLSPPSSSSSSSSSPPRSSPSSWSPSTSSSASLGLFSPQSPPELSDDSATTFTSDNIEPQRWEADFSRNDEKEDNERSKSFDFEYFCHHCPEIENLKSPLELKLHNDCVHRDVKQFQYDDADELEATFLTSYSPSDEPFANIETMLTDDFDLNSIDTSFFEEDWSDSPLEAILNLESDDL